MPPPSSGSQLAQTCKQLNETTPEKQTIKTPTAQSTPSDSDVVVLEKTPTTDKVEKRPPTTTLDSVEKSKTPKEKELPMASREKMNSGLSLKRKHGDDNKKYAKRGRPSKIDQAAREAARAAEAISVSITGGGDIVSRSTASVTVGHTATISSHRVAHSISRLELPALSIDKFQSLDIHGQKGNAESLILEVENDHDLNVAKVHRLRCLKGGQVTWEHFLSSKICAVCGSKYAVAVACMDETVSIFSVDGRRLLPSLVVGSPPSVLCCSNHYIMLITRKGMLFIWNAQTLKTEIRKESVKDFMSAKDSIDKAVVTPSGIPLVTLKNRKSYSFNPNVGCWVLVDYSEDKLQNCSNHHRCVPTKTRPLGPLSSLQKQSRPSDQAFRSFQSNPGAQQTLTLSHLENQVASSCVLESADEYRFWLETYIRYLSQEGLEVKLREICDELLGPVYRSKSSSSWSKFVLGVDKHSILRSVLPSIGADLRFQRLYTEYKEQLDMTQDS